MDTGWIYGLKTIIAAQGWRAVFVDTDPGDLESIMYTSPLIGWGLTEGDFGDGQGGVVVGLVAEDRVISAQEMPDFLGYIGPDEKPAYYEAMAIARLAGAGMIDKKGKKCKPAPKEDPPVTPAPKLRRQ